jgi:flavin-dependent dehydrogenase
VDPFVGEGIAMALRSAALLQNAFSQNRETVEAAYTRQWHEAFDSGLRFQQLTRQILSRRRLSEVAVRGMTTYPGALRWITQRTRPRLYAHT